MLVINIESIIVMGYHEFIHEIDHETIFNSGYEFLIYK